MNTADKIQRTVIRMRSPNDDASGPELAIATLVQGLSSPNIREWLQQREEENVLDTFLVALATWLLSHISDAHPVQVIIPMPRARGLPSGQILNLVNQAREIALRPPDDLLSALLEQDDEDAALSEVEETIRTNLDEVELGEDLALEEEQQELVAEEIARHVAEQKQAEDDPV